MTAGSQQPQAMPAGEASEAAAGETPGRRAAVPAALAAVVVAAVTLATFGQIVGFNFVHRDDRINVFQNPHLAPPVTFGDIAYFWTHTYYYLYMPLTYTVWALCARLGEVPAPFVIPGGDIAPFTAAAFHTVSLLLHAANAVLALFVLRRVLPSPAPAAVRTPDWLPWAAAAMGALLFAVHPLQVESVAWTTGMNNLIGGFFSLLALLEYVRWAQGDARPRTHFALATLYFVLALLSKPTSAAVPLMAAALDGVALKRPMARWLRPLAGWALLSLGFAVITHFAAAKAISVAVPLWARPFVAGDALAWYLGKTALPVQVSPVAGRGVHAVLTSWWGYATWLVPAALAVLLWRSGQRARYLLAALALFTAALLPMLGFVPYYATYYSTVADRYAYLALLGPALALAWCLNRAGTAWTPRLTPALFGAALAGIALLEARTLIQVPVWHDTFSLSHASVKTDPDDSTAQVNVAIDLGAKGDAAGAIAHLRTAAQIKPDDPVIALYLGRTLEETGDFAGAVEPLQRAVQRDPKAAEAQARLGVALAKTGHPAEAVVPLRAALEIQPRDAETRYILGVILGNLHRYPEAEAELAQVVAKNPAFPGAQDALSLVRKRAVSPAPPTPGTGGPR